MALTRRKKVLFASLALALGFLLAAILCESVVRMLFVFPAYPAAYFPLGGVAGASLPLVQEEYSIVLRYNRSGFRGADFPGQKASAEHRILVLGDSFAEGMGVTEEQRFSARLAERMKVSTKQDWRDINLGQIATNPISYFNNLVNMGVAFEPDIVVFALFSGNDFMSGRDTPPPTQYAVRRDVSVAAPSFWTLGYLRAFARRWTHKEMVLQRRMRGVVFWDTYFREPVNRDFFVRKSGLSEADFVQASAAVDPVLLQAAFAGRLNPSFLLEAVSKRSAAEAYYTDADYRNVLETILLTRRVCDSAGIRFVVLIIPDIYQVYPAEFAAVCKRWGFEKLPPRVLQLADFQQRMVLDLGRNQVEALDLTAALRSEQERTYYLLDSHWTAAGHEVAARELEKLLSKPYPAATLSAPPQAK